MVHIKKEEEEKQSHKERSFELHKGIHKLKKLPLYAVSLALGALREVMR